MKKILIVNVTILLVALFSGGCSSKFYNIGKEKGYCEEHGCDYSDAGVCGNPYDILANKQKAKELAYERIDCNCKESLK